MFGQDCSNLVLFLLLGSALLYFMYQRDKKTVRVEEGSEERYEEEESVDGEGYDNGYDNSYVEEEESHVEEEESIPEYIDTEERKPKYCETDLIDTGNDPYLKSVLYQDGLDKDPYYDYDRQYDRLTADELLPLPRKNTWTDVNPSILHRNNKDYFKAEENFLITNGRFVGILSGSQSNKNPNLQLRPEPPICYKSPGPWYNTDIGGKRETDADRAVSYETTM
jgi:hypothetical protein